MHVTRENVKVEFLLPFDIDIRENVKSHKRLQFVNKRGKSTTTLIQLCYLSVVGS